jgi:hypothetical protein
MSDIIDINVGETIEEVTINVTDNLITVNINKVTGGGGGTQTLAQTLDLGNTTGGENISISNGDAIILDNGSMLKKGTIDAGNGGAKGISQICGVGYEHKWEAGRLYIMNDGGTIIREVSHNFTITPTATDDVTKGFVQNTRWILDNGDVYVCTDATEDAAVWELQATQVNSDWNATSGVEEILNKPSIPDATSDLTNDSGFITIGDVPTPTLQEVTDEGATTTNAIETGNIIATDVNGGEPVLTLNYNTDILNTIAVFNDSNSGFSHNISNPLLTDNRYIDLPDADGTLALTSDIPDTSTFVPYTGATANVDLGTHKLLAEDLDINHTSGSGVAATITKGGSGEALTVVKTSGSGNAASITGGVTLLDELHLTTNLADTYIASAATWNAKFTLPALTSGSVLFSNGSTIAQDNANLFWDDTNNRLGIGATSPQARLDVRAQGALSTDIALRVRNSADTGDLVTIDGTGVLTITNQNTSSSISIASLLSSGATGDTYFSVGRSLTIYNSALIGHSTVGGGNYAFMAVYGRPASDFSVTSTGSIGIGTSLTSTSARLQINSTTQGFLPPRMTTTQKNAIASPAEGLVVYDSTLGKLCVRTASAWETITSL